jgi:pimeloyl-ACP methyl ester carboxylesterase
MKKIFLIGLASLLLTSTAMAKTALPAGFKSAKTSKAEVNLRYVRDGGTGETVILLHGFPQTWSSWVKMMPLLSPNYDVIAVDLRGVGGSDKPKAGYDKKTSAQDIKALMDELGIKKANIVGHDIGGMIAYAFAAQYPDMAESITIIDVPIPGTDIYKAVSQDPRAWHFAFHNDPSVPEALVSGRERFYYGNFMRRVDAETGKIGPKEISEAVAAYSVPATMTTGFNWFRTFGQDVTDNKEFFKTKLTTPVLGLNAGKLAPFPYVVEMMKPYATTVEGQMMDSGHWIPESVPEETVKLLDDFFKKY